MGLIFKNGFNNVLHGTKYILKHGYIFRYSGEPGI